MTPLFMTVAQEHSDIVAELMKAGADVSIRGPKGKTPVDIAHLRYGDGGGAAREKSEDPAIVALLEGKTWADVEADRRAWELAENSIRRFREDFPWKKGVEIHDCDGCPKMVLIPSGSFTMGSPPSEAGATTTRDRCVA